VAGSLEGRITKLENGGGRECPECGFDGDWSKVELEWCDHAEEEDVPQETVYCETCGQPTTIVVTWDGEA
jgi:hypothetical protein